MRCNQAVHPRGTPALMRRAARLAAVGSSLAGWPAISQAGSPCGPPGPLEKTPYHVVIDIDRDGQPGGVANPGVVEDVRSDPQAIFDAIAALFFGDVAVTQVNPLCDPYPLSDIIAAVAQRATEAESGDIDCDGDEDVVFVAFEFVSILRQGEGGAFAAPTPCATIGGSPNAENAFKLADLSGDKCPEIVGVSTIYGTPPTGLVQVFANNGTGVFASPSTLSIPNTVFGGCAAGDIDADGTLEIAVIDTPDAVSILRKTASNTLTPLHAATGQPLAPGDLFSLSNIVIAPFLQEVQLADLNKDGKAEIVASDLNDVFIRVNNADGTFGPVFTLDGESGTKRVTVADLNNDGRPEIIAVNVNNDELHLWPSTGPLQWGPRVDLPVGSSPIDVNVADVNADGKPDLLTTNRVDGDAVIFLNTGAGPSAGAGMFAAPQRFQDFTFRGGMTSVASGDFDNDGDIDIVGAVENGEAHMFLNRGDGTATLEAPILDRVSFNTFEVAALPALPGGASGRDRVAMGFIGRSQFAVFDYDPTRPIEDRFFLLHLGTTTGTVTSIATCDLNADGLGDIALTVSGSSPAAQVFLGTAAGAFGTPVNLNLPTAGWDQFIVPPANSGLPTGRYYIADDQTGSVVPLDHAGGAFTAGTPMNFGTGCTDFGMGDIEGDYRADLLASRAGSPTGTVVVQTGLDQPVPPAQTVVALPRSPTAIAVGDINADGKNDVVVSTSGPANQNHYVISVLNSGTALDAATARLHQAGERPQRPLLVDLHVNPDQRSGTPQPLSGPEVVIPNRDTPNFQWLCTMLVLPNLVNFAPPSPACMADFNTDGVVSTPDLAFFLGRFGEAATPGSQAERADFNDDGTVNTPDLAFFLGRFGELCS